MRQKNKVCQNVQLTTIPRTSYSRQKLMTFPDVDDVKNFFVKESGSIAITEAICLTHKIDISGANVMKLFLQRLWQNGEIS
jgi:hypothetical protein